MQSLAFHLWSVISLCMHIDGFLVNILSRLGLWRFKDVYFQQVFVKRNLDPEPPMQPKGAYYNRVMQFHLLHRKWLFPVNSLDSAIEKYSQNLNLCLFNWKRRTTVENRRSHVNRK